MACEYWKRLQDAAARGNRPHQHAGRRGVSDGIGGGGGGAGWALQQQVLARQPLQHIVQAGLPAAGCRKHTSSGRSKLCFGVASCILPHGLREAAVFGLMANRQASDKHTEGCDHDCVSQPAGKLLRRPACMASQWLGRCQLHCTQRRSRVKTAHAASSPDGVLRHGNGGPLLRLLPSLQRHKHHPRHVVLSQQRRLQGMPYSERHRPAVCEMKAAFPARPIAIAADTPSTNAACRRTVCCSSWQKELAVLIWGQPAPQRA